MPNGFRIKRNTSKNKVWQKRHRNGERTEVNLQKTDAGNWWGTIVDEGQTQKLGEFVSKAEAETAAKNWMQQNPKGLQQAMGSGIIPGADDQGDEFFNFF